MLASQTSYRSTGKAQASYLLVTSCTQPEAHSPSVVEHIFSNSCMWTHLTALRMLYCRPTPPPVTVRITTTWDAPCSPPSKLLPSPWRTDLLVVANQQSCYQYPLLTEWLIRLRVWPTLPGNAWWFNYTSQQMLSMWERWWLTSNQVLLQHKQTKLRYLITLKAPLPTMK